MRLDRERRARPVVADAVTVGAGEATVEAVEAVDTVVVAATVASGEAIKVREKRIDS